MTHYAVPGKVFKCVVRIRKLYFRSENLVLVGLMIWWVGQLSDSNDIHHLLTMKHYAVHGKYWDVLQLYHKFIFVRKILFYEYPDDWISMIKSVCRLINFNDIHYLLTMENIEMCYNNTKNLFLFVRSCFMSIPTVRFQ